MAQLRQRCEKCGRSLPVNTHSQYWRKRDGDWATICKQCLVAKKDPRNEKEFFEVLEYLDFPYVEKTWITQFNAMYRKDPDQFNEETFLGKYLQVMRLRNSPYTGCGFADTERLNQMESNRTDIPYLTEDDVQDIIEQNKNRDRFQELKETKKKIKDRDKMNKLRHRAEKLKEELGENVEDIQMPGASVSELVREAVESAVKDEMRAGKLKTKNSKAAQPEEPKLKPSVPVPEPEEETPQTPSYVPSIGIDEESIVDELTEEDKKYLALKWGMLYKPSEWVTLEDKYQKYAAEYEMNVDREEVLRSICKTNLKMDQALDVCDFKAYKDLSMVYDQLRKSGKFTESQNKEQVTRDIDSIGELVAFVEGEGGIIPHFESPIEYPKDKVDFIIKDLKNYTVNLVKNELGLGDLIESFIEKVKENKTKSVEEMVEEGFTSVSDDLRAEAEARDYQRMQMTELEEESKRLVEEYGA
jgi:hypothetical protein